jgi:translation elongation factor P/translation initiation factor 5A
MKTKILDLTTLALFPAALLTFTSCSSTPSTSAVETTSTAAFQHGVPGGVAVETHKITAKVTDIDAAKRKVTLLSPDGKKTSITCGPEVINFDQIRVGDQLKATVTQELAVAMAAGAGPGAAPPSDGAATVVALAPKGAKPGGIIANTVQVTAKVTAIDLKGHEATLLFPDGTSRTVAVRKDVDLTRRKVGEEVVICTTETVAISVEEP